MNHSKLRRRVGGWLLATLLIVACATLAALLACGDVSCEETATCSNPTRDAASDDAHLLQDAADAPTDPCVNNTADPKCLDEATAFFVSAAKGDDSAPGTRNAPLRSVAAALGRLTPTKKRVYICEGNYNEDVLLTSSHAGASLFGGFNCDWQPNQASPHFGKTTLALKIEKTTGVALADLTFEAVDATASGESSLACLAATAEVTMKRVSLLAGNGMRGDNGVTVDFALPSNRDGCNGGDGGVEFVLTCPGGAVTIGGRGGIVGGFPGNSGSPGARANAGNANCSGPTSIDTDGDPAPPTADGDGGLLGQLTETGWKVGDGVPGPPGAAGQGGGGGFSGGGGIGGGGGAGGCGGAGGAAGRGGGGSIALASFLSTVRLENCTLHTKDGANGGNGAIGQAGQGKTGMRSSGSGTSCGGGLGGAGAKGGNGGNGAGGVSIGVLYKEFKPEIDVATLGKITVGQAGSAGTGPGRPGQQLPATNVYELK